ncbi:MAG: hypothetical protein K1X56_09340 [Flavobacteriales bacterium]|nr:hypothetical protein [Flavobacteriales bacterium]
MSIENIVIISIPVAVLVLIVVYSSRNSKDVQLEESDPEDEKLFDPLTGREISFEEAENGIAVSEEDEKKVLDAIEFEELDNNTIEKLDPNE